MSVPGALKHNWTFDLELSSTNSDGERCYRCAGCKMWIASTELDKAQSRICPARERRRASRRKWADRRKPADDTMLIYACALLEVKVMEAYFDPKAS